MGEQAVEIFPLRAGEGEYRLPRDMQSLFSTTASLA